MKSKNAGGVLDTVRTVIYAVLIALFVRTVAYEPFNIPSGSMIPTLLVGDYLFVSKFSYGYSRYSLPFGLPLFSGRIFFTSPKRGDVVVFKLPRDPSVDYIKRVVGLPGDRIQVRDSVLYINDQPVKRERIEDYVSEEGGVPLRQLQYMETLPNGVRHRIIQISENGPLDNTDVYVVPQGHFFMMGDNRDNSLDSRVAEARGGVGFVPAENLVGRAEFLFFSTNGSARLWEFWKWPFAIRYERPFEGIH
ncbi:MAG: signal peptidase I [Alphaproteobacteria bacterium]|nr:signal peptidase I [Alphaproteobacteria bacterium]